MAFLGFERRLVSLILLSVVLMVGCELKAAKPTNNMNPVNAGSPSTDGATTAAVNETGKSKRPSDEKTSETISAEGSSTVYPICQAFAVEFEKKSKHKVSVGRQGTGGGYKKFVIHQADVWNASRPIDAKEIEELKSKGINWLELNIAVDGIVIAVNPQNTWCSNLTCAQLKQIWEPDSRVKNWSDLDPAWPAEEIVLYGADVDSGTFEYFTEVINDKKKAINTRYTPSSDDNILVQGIASNKFSLGYIPFGYYEESTDKLKPLGVSPTKNASETPAPYVQPTEETILSGEYAPLARPLFMYASTDSMKRQEVVDFLRFAVSEAAQPLVANRNLVRVKDEVLKKMQKKLEDAIADQSSIKN